MFRQSIPTAPWYGLSISLLERAKSGGLFGKHNISLRTSWATWCALVSVASSRAVTINFSNESIHFSHAFLEHSFSRT
ncbi:hypothetical protein GQ457_03G021720 [Hibiscus cannabinus]